MAQAIDSALFLFESRIRKESVVVERQIAPTANVAWCDRNRLQQVLVNLIGNALDAMRDEPVRRLSFNAEPASSGMLALAVSDSGCGFSEEALV